MHPVQVKKWTTVQQLRLGYKPLCNPAFLVSSRVFGPEALRRCFSTVLPGRKSRVRRLATSMARHLARPAKCVRTPLFAKTLNSAACARRPADRACLLCAGEMAYSQRQTGVSVRCICALYMCAVSVRAIGGYLPTVGPPENSPRGSIDLQLFRCRGVGCWEARQRSWPRSMSQQNSDALGLAKEFLGRRRRQSALPVLLFTAPGRGVDHRKGPGVGIPARAQALVPGDHLRWGVAVAVAGYRVGCCQRLQGAPIAATVASCLRGFVIRFDGDLLVVEYPGPCCGGSACTQALPYYYRAGHNPLLTLS